ncbi:MAG: glycoside hydrolase [Ruminococcaceae bacterium]|nr:glycoside hydrolase [Oscillospiraceae bacterium]
MISRFTLKPGEYFWGGSTAYGTDMPITAGSSYSRDFRQNPSNQMMPLFLSSEGRYIWSEDTFKVWVDGDELCFDGGTFELWEGGNCLRDAYLAAMEAHFPFRETRVDGKKLPREFFMTAQYNSWMEFTYHPTQAGILEYAHAIIDHGFEPGILIIDEGWHTRYGQWKFDFAAFPDPKAMVDELHRLGFKVMLWVTPMVTPDGQEFIMDTRADFNPESWDKLFLRTKDNKVALVEWWNGFSAILDFRKECDRQYLDSTLQFRMKEYGVDGFKFDGGSYAMYRPEHIQNGEAQDDHNAEALNVAWNEFGARYTFHEYKDTFKGGGKATIQRLRDRGHCWDGDGINTLLPCSILQGLMGHPFICPDMIGGGEWSYNMRPGFKIDEELFIRMAQASALFPMMQFSWAPWRALSEGSYKIVAEAGQLHKRMADKIIALVADAEKTGEPILRALEYADPHKGYAHITDEYLLGNDILVCPIITKGTTEKDVTFPAGRWMAEDGSIYDGNSVVRLAAPMERLLWFRRV